MKINYLLYDVVLRDDMDMDFFESLFIEGMYLDEIVINLFVESERYLQDSIRIIKKIRFGMLRRFPLVNMYFDIKDLGMVKKLNNEIKNFITPIIRIDYRKKGVLDDVKNALNLFEDKGWTFYLLMDVKSIEEYRQCIEWYNMLKCEFFDKTIIILFNFRNNSFDLLEAAYKQMFYVRDTIEFLGMRNNIIIDCLLKAIREKETGIHQEFNAMYSGFMEKLMRIDIETHKKKTLVRAAMDDFAMG